MIWLGTYATSPEAARAYDAGIFYTHKIIPFNFQDSEGSFPPLPEHLSLHDFDPVVMDEINLFVKEKALEAAMREKVTTTQELSHTKEKKVEKESSSVGAEEQCALSSDKMEEPCILSCDKMASANYEDAHVKNQGDDGWDTITPNAFENLEPLPCELPNCSDQAFWNDVIFWAEIPLVVHDYKPQTGMFGDEDLNNTQQASCLMDEVSFDRCHQEEKVGLMNRVFTYAHFLF
jgi:hypothetical protein